jgi:formyltetrahydrofolate-dependent phosphoribosylglycinamide formyltransferase
MASIAVLASGRGSTLKYLLDARESGFLEADIVRLVVDREGTGAESLALDRGIPLLRLDRKSGEAELSRRIEEELRGKVDLVVCAGFLSILTEPLLSGFRGRIINIHPALLPGFGGKGMYGMAVHRAVIASGSLFSGCSVHYVEAGVDSGEVIGRRRVPVFPSDDAESLARRVEAEEKPLLTGVINRLAANMELIRAAVIGSGGREHALCWNLLRDETCETVFALPGNGGTAALEGCSNLPLPAADDELVSLLRNQRVNLVVIGPEVPLAAGMADRLRFAGFPVFGPDAGSARLEGSKAFAKDFMRRHGVATAAYSVFDASRQSEAVEFARNLGWQAAVKADGIAAGKGVLICKSRAEVESALRSCFGGAFGEAGYKVVIEELLEGPEISLFVLTDGVDSLLLPSARDYKRAFDGDLGGNTGGMGSVAPAPDFTDAVREAFTADILEPTLSGLRRDGLPFRGVIFFGLMLTPAEPKLLEYNVRFGDPETQSLMPLLPDTFARLLLSCAEGCLSKELCHPAPYHACSVAAVSEGYPEAPVSGRIIEKLPPSAETFHIFIAGAELKGPKLNGTDSGRSPGKLISTGGRVLSATAWADTPEKARAASYKGMSGVSFGGMRFRRDIGGV